MHNLSSVHFVSPLHVLGVTTAHHQEAHLLLFLDDCCPGWFGTTQPKKFGFDLYEYIEMHGEQNIKYSM